MISFPVIAVVLASSPMDIGAIESMTRGEKTLTPSEIRKKVSGLKVEEESSTVLVLCGSAPEGKTCFKFEKSVLREVRFDFSAHMNIAGKLMKRLGEPSSTRASPDRTVYEWSTSTRHVEVIQEVEGASAHPEPARTASVVFSFIPADAGR